MAADASPSAIGDVNNGKLAVLYEGSDGVLQETYNPGGGWASISLGDPMG